MEVIALGCSKSLIKGLSFNSVAFTEFASYRSRVDIFMFRCILSAQKKMTDGQ